MSVEEASGFFTEKAVRPMLGALADVGLGCVRLGSVTGRHLAERLATV